ncbi:serine/threonine kinase receptor associated protein [Amanita rubescens]|nr:serine/threonine kinase receptor associated protein [Amanita rubescens]
MLGPPKSVPLVAAGHTRPVTHLSFSSLQNDGTYLLVSSCKDGNPMLREWTGDWIGTFLGHKGAVWSAKLSGDASRACDRKVWDTYSGDALHSFPHNHIVRTVSISPDSKRLLTGGQEKKVRIFDLNKPEAEPDFLFDNDLQTHEGVIKSVVCIDEQFGVSAGEDGKIKWWDLRNRQNVATIPFPNPITSMELSSQTERLVVTSGHTVAFIPQLPNDLLELKNVILPYRPSSASIHPVLKDRFVTGNLADEWVRVHGMSGEEREILKGHHGPVHCVEFSPDGEMYASGSEDGTIRLWQTTPGKSYGLWQA